MGCQDDVTPADDDAITPFDFKPETGDSVEILPGGEETGHQQPVVGRQQQWNQQQRPGQ